MPVEIRELIVNAKLEASDLPNEGKTKVYTEEDKEELKQEIADYVMSAGGMTPEAKRRLMDEIIREVRKLIEDKWRR